VVRRRYPSVRVIAMSGSFSGNEVPSGVAADAFYEKGSSIGALLRIMGKLPQMEQRVPLPPIVAVPVWIRRSGHGSSPETCATIVCPECQRTFTQAFSGSINLVRETDCIYCRSSIRYAIAEPSAQRPSQAFRQGTSTAIAAQNAPTLSY
jgi:hypothetical protein